MISTPQSPSGVSMFSPIKIIINRAKRDQMNEGKFIFGGKNAKTDTLRLKRRIGGFLRR